ncbi:MAG TPA: amidohydrolase family protein [Terriglobales bacterium]|nr:amidohydrolase family protein [Terriglobales bacterium]
MKCFWVVLFVASAALAQTPAKAKPEPVTIIKAGVLIDGVSSEPKRDVTIVIRGNKIESVGQRAAILADGPQKPRVIDLSGYTVMPGMIDAHTHLFLQGEDPAEGGYDAQLLKFPISYRAARATVSARRALEQGFTTIRDMETEGAGYGDVGIKMAVNEGRIPGPRIFTSTRAISTTGGYNLEDYAPEVTVPKGAQIIDGPVEARKAAREQLEHGADWIKVYMTHRSWLNDKGDLVSQPTLTVEELKGIVDEAHGWGRKVACHAYNGIGLQRALDGGCDSLEHGLELTDANIAQMLKQGTWYCPTMAPYYDIGDPKSETGKRNQKRVDLHGPSLTKAYKAGVKIAFGTDVGGFSWSDPIAQEFERMVEFGMTPMDSIKSATSKAAELLGMQGKLGVIAPGAFADVVAVQGDPVADVKVLKDVRFVMKDGQVFKDIAKEPLKP